MFYASVEWRRGVCSSSSKYRHLCSRRYFHCPVSKRVPWQQRVWSDWPAETTGLLPRFVVTLCSTKSETWEELSGFCIWNEELNKNRHSYWRIARTGGCLVLVTQWHAVLDWGPGFNLQWLPTFQLTPFSFHWLPRPWVQSSVTASFSLYSISTHTIE